MSETQVKVTGNFQAADENGNQHHVTEYTIFRRTTTADMALNEDGDAKEYKLGNGTPVKQINETEFEIVSDGTKIRRLTDL